MKLKSFRINNYKSIKDSGECRLSDSDNVLVLAGQNESGKSAILQALYDYERGELRENCERELDGEDFDYPIIMCTYAIEEEDDILEGTPEEVELPDEMVSVFKSLHEITIIRKFSSLTESQLCFDDELAQKLSQANKKIFHNIGDDGLSTKTDRDVVDLNKLLEEIWSKTPQIIFFDDFCDLLPNKILISALVNEQEDAKGYNAVKNVEKLLDTDFTKYDTLSDALRASRQKKHTDKLTADFNLRWKQRIFDDNKVDIVINHNQGGGPSNSYLNFFIITKEGEYLTPEQRSKGLIWFLSFYLQLTAESRASDKLIILFDEPGLYLHSKAQNDIKLLFEELAEKDQVIYSTHSPYLIDADKLGRLRLIVNSKQEGTTINKITTKKIYNQKDALKPIIDAIGLEVAHNFSCVNHKNVILEGISDYHYLSALKHLFGIQNDFFFLPSMGASKVHLLMELCIGWGLDWLIILDDDRASKAAYKKIVEEFYNGEKAESQKRIYFIKGVEAIEDALTLGDLRLVDTSIQNPQNHKHSELVKHHGGKELFARIFNEKVHSGEITIDKLSKTAKDHFNAIFTFINEGFGVE